MGKRSRRIERKLKEREELRLKQCGSPEHQKRRYLSRYEAFMESQRMTQEHAPQRFSCYRCDFCGYWHVGHTPKERASKA